MKRMLWFTLLLKATTTTRFETRGHLLIQILLGRITFLKLFENTASAFIIFQPTKSLVILSSTTQTALKKQLRTTLRVPTLLPRLAQTIWCVPGFAALASRQQLVTVPTT